MSIIVGSARIGENGSIYGGKDGDQTGREVCTQNFYEHQKGWYILRAKSAAVANKLAKAMQIACSNDNIGYNQLERYDVVKKGIETKEKANADCSALVRACIIWATGTDVGDFRTVNQVSVLEKSGLFEKHIAYLSGSKLYNGDILVTKTSGHTVIVVGGAAERNVVQAVKLTVPQPTIKKGSKGTAVKNLQKCLNHLKMTDNTGKSLVVDGEVGIKTETAIKKFQKSQKITVDGIYGKITYAKMKSAVK